ncbi:phage head-tail connector protein [Sediminibacillus massiliensis]|uniref:phage head-tail connector protein n=1 Tax=Sediminibacillus massiliensis TaxID=1926277 RepID=UPI0009887D5B|nr:phage head-tail connector protein [Sediminibacillus massiliensis]
MAVFDDVKVLLGIDDTLQDKAINIIIRNTEAHLKIWLKKYAGLDEIPAELEFIITELSIIRFQKRGSEGMSSESVEGHSVSYNEDDFKPYSSILNTYIPVEPDRAKKGKAMFF